MARTVTQTTTVVAPPSSSIAPRVKLIRRTNVYIAEYILMLIFFAIFLGILAALWFSFFGLITATGYGASSKAVMTTAGLASLLVFGPAAYWLYARVTGEENANPAVLDKKARTVFLTLWMIGAIFSLACMLYAAIYGIVTSIFGMTEAGTTFVNVVIPGLLSSATLGFGISVVVKHASRKLAVVAGIVLASVAAVLLIANLVMVIVKKDSTGSTNTSSSSSSRSTTTTNSYYTRPSSDDDTCTISKYLDSECTYEEYLQDN